MEQNNNGNSGPPGNFSDTVQGFTRIYLFFNIINRSLFLFPLTYKITVLGDINH